MGAASELYDCSGGKLFYFLLDSISAWMTIEWDSGADTIRYGDAGTFWYRPDSLPLPWRRFGVIADSTDIPADYDGEITVCMQDVTNAPVVAYGEPVHLHPRGVDPFMECDGIPHCCPAPPEPVCWSFYVHPTGVAEPQSNNIGKSAMSLKIAGDISADFSIAYNCPENSKLVIYDVLGRAVFQRNVSGVGKINWSEENTRTGVYFAMLKYDGKSVLRKIILVK
ncbi:T9SS type A sorting domain-containing protein [bacterium]|nr:T9SS type A sorting domain-containing protein [bacterium]